MRRARRLPLEHLAPFLLEVPPEPAALNWERVFVNPGPLEIEVGFGKGLFLVRAAQAFPGVNYLGIEISRKYQLFTATRLAKRGLGNVRLAKADARAFLRDHVAAGSCQAIHVYFPDPWWKKRHVKRRVFTAEFVGQCARVLQSGGWLHVATDVADYFQLIMQLITAQSNLRPLLLPQTHEPTHDLDYLTNFERKFRQAGKPIYRGSYAKQ
ncbi:MAG TPA: tRNA (guanosine(46)-N7)-methyltransferase TrmB [Gemmataceae bacterium]|nr:tRNA (guanosine(46)-N7)-methyltransferase TrmB [Gemmataceae bacterium]